MNALIIGGTRGFGADMAECLGSHGCNVITVGRSATQTAGVVNYVCDVGDLTAWRGTAALIAQRHPQIDVLAFVVGHAAAAIALERTTSDWTLHLHRNLTYVAMAFPLFVGPLGRSPLPRIATVGSQWSYRSGCEELLPYITAKQALRSLSRELAVEHPGMRLNHFCLPTMDTPGYHAVAQTFREIGRESVIAAFSENGLASSQIVAKAMCKDLLERRTSGKTVQIRAGGTIQVLDD